MNVLIVAPVLGILAFSLLSPRIQADLILVDAAGGGDFTQIKQAVAQALNGDTILVKSGTYAPFPITNKSLAVVADVGAQVFVNGYVAVVDLAAEKSVLLSGLHAEAQLLSHLGALYLRSNSGPVRVQNCSFVGKDCPYKGGCPGNEQSDGLSGVWVDDNLDLAFIACQTQGGDGWNSDEEWLNGGNGGHGLQPDSYELPHRIAAYGTTFVGGNGGDGLTGGWGGGGAYLFNAWFFAAGSAFQGGDGGDGSDQFPSCGEGGAGLWNFGSAVLLDDLLVGGDGGVWQPHGSSCADGPPSWGSGSVDFLAGTAREFVLDPVAREGTTASLTFRGEPGDRVVLVRGDCHGFRYSASEKGVWLFELPGTARAVGALDATGTLVVPYAVPELPAGAEEAQQILQPLFVSASSAERVLGNARYLTIIDAAF